MTLARGKIVTAARWGIAHDPPDPLRRDPADPAGEDLAADDRRSGFVTLCYYLAGAPDPNGLDYDGEGWTETLLRHLEQLAPEDVRRGDVVVWGRYPARHCAIVLEPGEDPLLCSHGRERGPVEIRFSTESRYQPATVTWLGGSS